MFKERVVLFSAAFALDLDLAIVSQVFAEDIQKLNKRRAKVWEKGPPREYLSV